MVGNTNKIIIGTASITKKVKNNYFIEKKISDFKQIFI